MTECKKHPTQRIREVISDPKYKPPTDPNYPENPPAVVGPVFTAERRKKK